LELVREDTRRLMPEHFEDVEAVIDLSGLSLNPTEGTLTDATWAINHAARTRTAELSKKSGVQRHILGSSCSVYGFQRPEVCCTEDGIPDPVTTYAKTHLAAERDVLPLADEKFCVTALRQSTVFGRSPRMRFDIAINRMTQMAFQYGRLQVMRDGSQCRPWVHIQDTVAAMCHMLDTNPDAINHQVFNVGSDQCTMELLPLAKLVAQTVPRDVEVEFYGDPDNRSYRVSFSKIEALGFRAVHSIEDGINEIVEGLQHGEIDASRLTTNLDWYQALEEGDRTIPDVEMYGGIFDIGEIE